MAIIVPRASNTPTPPDAVRTADRSRAWTLLSWLGGTFALLGLIDIALGWYPTAFGNSEWEFGTISGSLNALTVPMIGMYLLAASAIARGDRRSARVVSVILALFAVGLAVLGFIYVTVVPIALSAVKGNELVHLGMKKAIIKGILLGVGYLFLLLIAAKRTWGVPSDSAP